MKAEGESVDSFVNILGIIYGVVLILAAFVNHRLLEAMRLDALIMQSPSANTRPVNLVAGLLVAGYAIYSLLKL